MKNRRKTSRLAVALVAVMLLGAGFVVYGVAAFADTLNVQFAGDAAQETFQIVGNNRLLFKIDNLFPGETATGTVTINHTGGTTAIDVGMYTEGYVTSDNDPDDTLDLDLGELLWLEVTDDRDPIFAGWAADFYDNIEGIGRIKDLGQMQAGGEITLHFDLEFVGSLNDVNGKTADAVGKYGRPNGWEITQELYNKYMEATVSFDLVFAAHFNTPPDGPGPGPGPGPGTGPTGRGGGTTPTTTADTPTAVQSEGVTTAETPAGTSDAVTLDAAETPLGVPDFAEDEPIITLEEETPLGSIKDMPTTGEISLALYVIPGLLMMGLGLLLLTRKGKKESR